jgi:hypothetical protein
MWIRDGKNSVPGSGIEKSWKQSGPTVDFIFIIILPPQKKDSSCGLVPWIPYSALVYLLPGKYGGSSSEYDTCTEREEK